MFDRQGARLNVRVIRPALAPTRLERGGRRLHKALFILRALHCPLGVRNLRIRDNLYRWTVSHQGKAALNRRAADCDLVPNKHQSKRMLLCDAHFDHWVRVDQRFLAGPRKCGTNEGLAVQDLPQASAVVRCEVDDAQVAALTTGRGRRNAIEGSFRSIDPGTTRECSEAKLGGCPNRMAPIPATSASWDTAYSEPCPTAPFSNLE